MGREHMTSDGLARIVASKNRLTLEESRQIVDLIFESIASGLRGNVETWVPRFGKFCLQHKPARMVVNPKTCRMVMGSPKTLVRLRLSSVIMQEHGDVHRS